MTRNNLDNPIFLFIIFILAITVNAIASIHFLLVMFAGILFTAFYRCLKKRYLYSLTFTIITFLFIEINSGLKPFSLTLLSLFIYVFILPKDESHTSYNTSSGYLYMIFFYVGLLIIWSISFGINFEILLTLFFNLIIDLTFFGAFLCI
jgi:hypothetical protein